MVGLIDWRNDVGISRWMNHLWCDVGYDAAGAAAGSRQRGPTQQRKRLQIDVTGAESPSALLRSQRSVQVVSKRPSSRDCCRHDAAVAAGGKSLARHFAAGIQGCPHSLLPTQNSWLSQASEPCRCRSCHRACCQRRTMNMMRTEICSLQRQQGA